MHVGFVCFGFENIGVEYLSACLKRQGHSTSLFFDPLLFDNYVLKIGPLADFFDMQRILIDRVVSSDFDLLAFSVMTDNYQRACAIAKEIRLRRPDLPIVFGGVHPTAVPDLVIRQPFVDYVCVGEGEESLVELADAIEKNKDVARIANIWSKQNGNIIANRPRILLEDLDELPFPDKDIFYSEFPVFKKCVYRINVGRGCKLDCSFCNNGLMRKIYRDSGYTKRRRSVGSVIDELRVAKKRLAISHVLIIDDWFTDDKKWLEEFAREFKREIGCSFACDVYPGNCDEQIVALLENAGCSVASMGIQTLSEKLRKTILNRHDSNEAISRTFSMFSKTKIFTYADFILGIPGQNEEELLSIADFVNKHRPDFVFFLWLRYYPRTSITDAAVKNGWITYEDLARINEGSDTRSYFGRPMNYKKESARFASFVSTIPILPRRTVDFMLRKRMYGCFPESSFFYFRFMSLFVVFIKRLSSGKNGVFYFSMLENCRFQLFYLLKIIFAKLGKRPLIKKDSTVQEAVG